MTKFGKTRLVGQRPSNRIPYSPAHQPDIGATENMRGQMPALILPEWLVNDGDPLHRRDIEQLIRERELLARRIGLRSSPRSILGENAGVFAGRDAGGTEQNIPPDINYLMVGSVEYAFNTVTNTFDPAPATEQVFDLTPPGAIPTGWEIAPNSFSVLSDSVGISGNTTISNSDPNIRIVITGFVFSTTGSLDRPEARALIRQPGVTGRDIFAYQYNKFPNEAVTVSRSNLWVVFDAASNAQLAIASASGQTTSQATIQYLTLRPTS